MWDKAGQALRRMAVTVRGLIGLGLLLILMLIGCADDTKGPCTPVALYGPPPCNDDKDCNQYGAGYYCDKKNTLPDGCGGTSTWATCKPGAVPDGGVKDIGKTDGCQPVMLYGPPPCNDDKDCVNWYGAGYTCDKNNSFGNGCGGTSTWALCKPSAVPDGGVKKDVLKTDACQPVALYGPKPCVSDAECITDHGAGWYCDKNNTFGNGCGGTSTWPICRQKTAPDGGITKTDGCMPVALYGPPPCNTDADCVKWYGAGYTCNKNNTYSNGCGGTSTWPICVK